MRMFEVPGLNPVQGVEITTADLDRPFSVCADGTLATVGAFIDAHSVAETRERLGRPPRPEDAPRVLRLGEIDRDGLDRLALAATERAEPWRRFIVNGRRLSPSEVAEEIRARTAIGEAFAGHLRRVFLPYEPLIVQGYIFLDTEIYLHRSN